MGSHYIPVGKIKFDKELLDVVCPAVGYTPELICTKENGYIRDPSIIEPYEPPMQTPNPAEEVIVLLVNSSYFGRIRFRVLLDVTANFKVDIFDENLNLIDSKIILSSNTTGFDYFYPASATYYILKIYPELSVRKITRFYTITQTNSIIQAKFNTPNLTSMDRAFYNCAYFEDFVLLSSIENVTTMFEAFRGTRLNTFTFPNCPALTTINGMLYGSSIKQVSFNQGNFPLLTDVQNFCRECSDLVKLDMSGVYAPGVNNFYYFVTGSNALKTVLLPTAIDPSLASVSFAYFASYCTTLEELIMPYVNSGQTVSLGYFAMSCPMLKKITFPGYWNITSLSSMLSGTVLKHVIYDKYFNVSIGALYNSIETVRLPDVLGTNCVMMSPYLREITNGENVEFENLPGVSYALIAKNIINLETLNLPKLAPFESTLTFGDIISKTGCSFKYINIDWANFSKPTTGGSETIIIICNADSNELNRIFELLQDCSGWAYQTYIKILAPGYATCDPSIATAKGWVVQAI